MISGILQIIVMKTSLFLFPGKAEWPRNCQQRFHSTKPARQNTFPTYQSGSCCSVFGSFFNSSNSQSLSNRKSLAFGVPLLVLGVARGKSTPHMTVRYLDGMFILTTRGFMSISQDFPRAFSM